MECTYIYSTTLYLFPQGLVWLWWGLNSLCPREWLWLPELHHNPFMGLHRRILSENTIRKSPFCALFSISTFWVLKALFLIICMYACLCVCVYVWCEAGVWGGPVRSPEPGVTVLSLSMWALQELCGGSYPRSLLLLLSPTVLWLRNEGAAAYLLLFFFF